MVKLVGGGFVINGATPSLFMPDNSMINFCFEYFGVSASVTKSSVIQGGQVGR